MATPLTIAIPPLQERQTIATWEPLFIAAVSAIDQKAAIKLLPAYVKRGRLEEKVVLGAMGKETLADALPQRTPGPRGRYVRRRSEFPQDGLESR